MFEYSLSGVIIALTLGYIISTRLSSYLTVRRFKAENGCEEPAAHYPLTWKDLGTGIKYQYDNVQAAKAYSYLTHMRRRFDRLGNTFVARIVFHPIIATIEPENLKAVFATNMQDFQLGEYRTETFKALLGYGIFTLDGHQWKHSRDLLRPAFAKSQFTDMDVYERHMQHLLELLPVDGVTEVDLQPLFFRLTMDSATEILLGKSVNSLLPITDKEDPASSFSAAYETAKWEVFKNVQMYPYGQYRNLSDMNAAIAIVHKYVDEYVDAAVALREKTATPTSSSDDEKDANNDSTSKKQYSFLRELANDSNDREKIRSELLSVLLAGRDTTAALLSNVFFVLSRRPDIWRRLRNEVDQLDGQKPSFSQLKEMRYLNWVLDESLRLHPVVPVNTRTATRSTVLPLGGGPDGLSPLHVPAGAQIVTNIYALHRRADIYGPDADEFRPERWATLRPRWGFLPFLGGPRVCPGQGMALTEAAYTVVRLVQVLGGCSGVGSDEWREELAITCCNANGTKVVLMPKGRD
ncbi:cytochrome P450 52A12 [Saccharata proteae CBS 121410]|uniref:Cytochrome P450 52A12 n=1 Tax=Saccharata proteae CBS 121410 TaxID=1314787 RepID=A0A6A5YA91_9PEZI|nr:cytochrome P450 52A12 [Saccharata proteae CBS 121410]